jgi:hypothetical protein
VSLSLDLPVDLEERLQQKAREEGINPADAAVRAIREALTLRSSPSMLPEAEIVQRLHATEQGFDSNFWDRYRELLAHVRDETMTEALREEFIPYQDRVEIANAERLRYLAELARRYSLSLPEVIGRFGVGPLTLPEPK